MKLCILSYNVEWDETKRRRRMRLDTLGAFSYGA
jgi:hypothetical protein